MQKVIILGAGGLARETFWIFCEQNKVKKEWEVLGFIDENPENHGKMLCDTPVLGGFNWFKNIDREAIKVVCGVGTPSTRKQLVEKAKQIGLDFCTIIHPNVKMSPFVKIGKGVVIAAGNILTTQVKIGNHVFLNLGCTIGHDVVIEDFCHIAPGVHISGNVTIKEGVNFGTGSVIIQGKAIGKWSIIGAGAVVVTDIPDHVTAVGIPARVIKHHLAPRGYSSPL